MKALCAPVIAMFALTGCASDRAPVAASPPPAAVASSPVASQPLTPQQQAGTSQQGGAQRTTWDVRTVRCDHLMGLDDEDRAAASMFYYGYLARAADLTVIDTRQIEGNLRKVMDQCARTPASTVPDAFRQALTQLPR